MAIKEIRGVVACKGKVRGRVRKVLKVEDIEKVEAEDIVVTNDNSPLFSIAFFKAKGIISEKGGLLSHLAIVAREMGKPCLLNVERATILLNDDDVICLDCDEGKVIIENE